MLEFKNNEARCFVVVRCFRASPATIKQHRKKKVVKCSPTQSAKAIKFELLSSSNQLLLSSTSPSLFCCSFFAFLLLLELGNVRVSRWAAPSHRSLLLSSLQFESLPWAENSEEKWWQKRGRCLLYNYFFARTFLVHYLPLCSVGRLPPLLPLFFFHVYCPFWAN